MDAVIAKAKKVYGRLPSGPRDAAASAYGWYLRWWRYSADSERLVQAALERDSWTDGQWQRYQEERLAQLLERAATRVPYYREQWKARREAGDASDWTELQHWPVLDKNAVRRDPRAFVADDVKTSRLFRSSTSGTSGAPITTWRSRRTMIEFFALFEARSRRWYGVDRSMPWASLGGQVVRPVEQAEPPFWIWNAPLRQLYMSSFHLSERNIAAYLEAMRQHGVRHMYGFASAMYWLARMTLDQGLTAPRLEVVVSNAEPLLPHQREVIGAVFNCPVRDTYGMAELVAAATGCEHGFLHIWPDVGVLEVMADDDDTKLDDGSAGRIVSTGLLNPDMPLIRYEVGDRGALTARTDEPCACGRALPRIDRIEGRITDTLVTADARRVPWYNWQFYDLPLREGQVVQESTELVRVNLVPDTGFDSGTERVIRERIQQRLGSIHVEIRTMSSIPRGANGKLSVVINHIRPDS